MAGIEFRMVAAAIDGNVYIEDYFSHEIHFCFYFLKTNQLFLSLRKYSTEKMPDFLLLLNRILRLNNPLFFVVFKTSLFGYPEPLKIAIIATDTRMFCKYLFKMTTIGSRS
jgi:hypothetical protein